jgi:hypothetical protein
LLKKLSIACKSRRDTEWFTCRRSVNAVQRGVNKKSSPVNQVSFYMFVDFYKADSDLSDQAIAAGMDLAPSHN